MKLSFPLWLKVSMWLVLNLALLAGVGSLFFFSQGTGGFGSYVYQAASNRMDAIARTFEREVNNPLNERDTVLSVYEETYGAQFFIFQTGGRQLGGQQINLPREIGDRLRAADATRLFQEQGGRGGGGRGGPFPGTRGGAGPRSGPASAGGSASRGGGGVGRPGAPDDTGFVAPTAPAAPTPPAVSRSGASRPLPPLERSSFMGRTNNPTRYWLASRMRLPAGEGPNTQMAWLIAQTDSLGGNRLIFDFRPWLIAAASAVGLSIIFWLPMVGGATRSLRRLTTATEKIAEGRFDTRVDMSRTDEIGRLGEAVNRMASRLDSHATGQRRFLGDIAHELGSPIGRMQFATSILEERVDPSLQPAVADVREEVQQMSELVNELLAFTRAGLKPREAAIAEVPLDALIAKVLDREDAVDRVTLSAQPGLVAMCDRNLLERAVGNLVRNALRYGGGTPVTLSAEASGRDIRIAVADEGEGVPKEALARLGEPFFRPETARTRETGGVGLGLAIVRSAIEACRGTLTFANRTPRGFIATITLPRADKTETFNA